MSEICLSDRVLVSEDLSRLRVSIIVLKVLPNFVTGDVNISLLQT
jgi:hypothetical protein